MRVKLAVEGWFGAEEDYRRSYHKASMLQRFGRNRGVEVRIDDLSISCLDGLFPCLWSERTQSLTCNRELGSGQSRVIFTLL